MSKGQSRKHSWYEAILNTIIGYTVSIISQEILFPVFGIHMPLTAHLQLGMYFTVVSVVRSYVLRRFFNFLHIKGWL